LAASVDDRAQRLQEGLASIRVLERSERPRDGLQVGAATHAAPAHAGTGLPDPAEQPRVDGRGEQIRHARQSSRPQNRRDLTSEAAARNQHEPLDALRELVEELHGHPAAQGVPHDVGPLDPDCREQVADAGGMGAQRVVPPRCRRVAVADQVGCDDRVPAGEPLGDGLPVSRGVEHAVDQDHGRAAAGDAVDHPASVKVDLPLLELRHAV